MLNLLCLASITVLALHTRVDARKQRDQVYVYSKNIYNYTTAKFFLCSVLQPLPFPALTSQKFLLAFSRNLPFCNSKSLDLILRTEPKKKKSFPSFIWQHFGYVNSLIISLFYRLNNPSPPTFPHSS